MKVEVEQLSTVEKRLSVVLPVEIVNSALDTQYRRLSKQVRVKGFRPGKVPPGLVKKMFRQEAQSGALQSLIQENMPGALEQAEIEPLNFPDVDREELVEGQPFKFSMLCQVKPVIELQGLDALSVNREAAEVTDDQINAEIEKLRLQNAELEPVEDRGADTGDIVTFDFVGTLDGEDEPFEGGSGSDHPLELGSGQFIEGFEDQLIGVKEDDEKVVDVTFSEEYGAEHLAGKSAHFACKVKGVRRKVLAEVDDDFAVDLDYDDLSAMRAAIFDDLFGAAAKEKDADVREQLIKGLIEANPIEIPVALIEMAKKQLKNQLGMHLAMNGMPKDQIDQALAAETESLAERAKEMAHRDLLLDAAATQGDLLVSEEELDERIGEIAADMNQPKAKVRASLQQNDRINNVRGEMLQEKTLRWLEEKALGQGEGSTTDSTEGNATTDEASADEDDDAKEES
jgi:trigger factor